MSILDGILGGGGNLDLGALAGKVGLNEDELRQGGAALLSKLAQGHDPQSAATAASAETGVDAGALTALLPALAEHLGHADTGSMLSNLTGEGGLLSKFGGEGGIGGALGGLTGMFGGNKE